MPCTPMPDSASRTSSSLNGLMMAVTSFMRFPLSEGLADREHENAPARVLELAPGTGRQLVGEAIEARIGDVAAALRGSVDVRGAEDPARDVLGDPDFPIGVIAVGGVGAGAPALELEVADVAHEPPAAAQVIVRRQVPVV